MSEHSRRSLLATAGTALAGTLAGCSALDGFSGEPTIEYDESALAGLPGDVPRVPAAEPVQPTPAHLEDARERIRSLIADTDLSRIPNAAVRARLDREREAAREGLTDEEADWSRVDALAGLTHPRSEAMFVHAALAAFDGTLTAADLSARRERHQRDVTSLLDDYQYVGGPDTPVETLVQHARIIEWAETGSRILDPDEHSEYENAVLHAGEVAQGIEWGRAYASDARRLRDDYVSMLAEPTDYTDRFEAAAATLVTEVETHAEPPDWDTLTSDFDRDLENTAAERLLVELARTRSNHAADALEEHHGGHAALALASAMTCLTADRAFAAATEAIEAGGYEPPQSVEPIAAERTAAVEHLDTLLDTAPAPLAFRLASRVSLEIQNGDRRIQQDRVSTPARYLYSEYALANQYAAAAPAVVERVGTELTD